MSTLNLKELLGPHASKVHMNEEILMGLEGTISLYKDNPSIIDERAFTLPRTVTTDAQKYSYYTAAISQSEGVLTMLKLLLEAPLIPGLGVIFPPNYNPDIANTKEYVLREIDHIKGLRAPFGGH
ncbi:hypothetical protein BGZ65_009434 [Modicella reniformis]|uniref:Uncharacterized protein n=1 Tax=Modicella reniformis TaxID=1440133 RepID=A0A9P6M252_9FUNG|nr:hypothetical protein BGZ65_009434 [Modicella reniformis]